MAVTVSKTKYGTKGRRILAEMSVATPADGIYVIDDAGVKRALIETSELSAENIGAFNNNTDCTAAFNAAFARADVKSIAINNPRGGNYLVNGTINCQGKQVSIATGCKLTGAGKISNAIIHANIMAHVFDTSLIVEDCKFSTPFISVKWFGALGNGSINGGGLFGGNDDTYAIQKAINTALYFNTYDTTREIYLPPGNYRITNTLHLSYGFAPGFKTVNFKGSSYGVANPGDSVILCDFTDRQGINLQGVRRCNLSDFTMVGKYTYTNAIESRPDIKSNFINGSVNALPGIDFDKRFAPYAAITTDAYGSLNGANGNIETNINAPTFGTNGPYPDINYDPLVLTKLGLVNPPSYGGKAFSSTITFKNVSCSGFVAAWVINPCAQGTQNDYINFTNCFVESCVYAWSTGAPNSRQLNLINCVVGQVHTVITTTKHGQAQGNFGSVVGCEFSYVYQWHDVLTSFGGTIGFKGCYGEGITKLGKHSSLYYGSKGVIYDSCEFGFTQGDNVTYGNFFDNFVTGYLSVFNNCGFSAYCFLTASGDIKFLGNCVFHPYVRERHIGPAPNVPAWYTNFMRYFYGAILPANGKKTAERIGLLAEYLDGHNAIAQSQLEFYADQVFNVTPNGAAYRYINDVSQHVSSGLSSKSDIVYSGCEGIDANNFLSLNLNQRTLTGQFRFGGQQDYLRVGSIAIVQEQYVFIITALDDNTRDFTGLLINNFYLNVNGTWGDYLTPIVVNALDTIRFVNCNRFVHHIPVYGDLTYGSATITNVRFASGAAAANAFAVGDILAMGENLGSFQDEKIGGQLTVSGSGNPMRITGIPDATTLQLSTNVRVSNPAKLLTSVIIN